VLLTAARAIKALFTGGKDAESFRYGMGLWHPSMRPHYYALFLPGRLHHEIINLGTEWVRLDAQRAFKLGFDLITALIIWGTLHA
jgi:hypothetical protein